jgi:alpha-tubulin suppressor-like RCC1 family protein
LTNAGAAYCWGDDGLGQNHTTHTTPVAVPGAFTFASIAAGGTHACGLTTSGVAYCWGWNFYGQVGDGTTTDRFSPAAVAGGIAFASLAAGDFAHTCGLTSAGTAFCWGYNRWGELGIGPDTRDTSQTAPVAAMAPRLASLAAGFYHTCGLTSDGAAYCWGQNDYGQLGDGTKISRWSPVAVASGITFVSLTAGGVHTCGLTSGGAAYCWGENYFGELGDGTTGDRPTPGAVAGGIAFTRLTAGLSHTCGVTSGGAAYCWGDGANGELGTGSTTGAKTPALVVSP